jgi:hypothetical protein
MYYFKFREVKVKLLNLIIKLISNGMNLMLKKNIYKKKFETF